jgi:hypothetical protein
MNTSEKKLLKGRLLSHVHFVALTASCCVEKACSLQRDLSSCEYTTNKNVLIFGDSTT